MDSCCLLPLSVPVLLKHVGSAWSWPRWVPGNPDDCHFDLKAFNGRYTAVLVGDSKTLDICALSWCLMFTCNREAKMLFMIRERVISPCCIAVLVKPPTPLVIQTAMRRMYSSMTFPKSSVISSISISPSLSPSPLGNVEGEDVGWRSWSTAC